MDGLYSNFATDEVLILAINPSKQKGALEFLKKALLGSSYLRSSTIKTLKHILNHLSFIRVIHYVTKSRILFIRTHPALSKDLFFTALKAKYFEAKFLTFLESETLQILLCNLNSCT